MKLKKTPLYIKILLGMLIGVLWGILSIRLGWETFTKDWISPWGQIFLNLLKLIAVPLIFVSLVKGISSLSDITKLSSIGLKTFLLYLISTSVAVCIGLLLVNIFQPGKVISEDKRLELSKKYSHEVGTYKTKAEEFREASPLQPLVDVIPNNIFNAASDNKKMLQVIFFAVLFGIAMILVKKKHTKVVYKLVVGIDAIILKIVEVIMEFAPYGTLALMANLVVDFSGDISLFKALGSYTLVVVGGLICMIIIIYPLAIRFLTKIRLQKFFRALFPVQLVGFSTSSSAATLPVTMEYCQEKLNLSAEVTEFVLPVGVTINMDGTSCYQAIAAVFIAQVFGMDLTVLQQITIVLTAVVASIGTPGIPGGSIVMLTIILNTVGISPEGLALILGIDRPLDMLRTSVNVTGDSTVASIIDRIEYKKNSL